MSEHPSVGDRVMVREWWGDESQWSGATIEHVSRHGDTVLATVAADAGPRLSCVWPDERVRKGPP